MNQSRCFFTKLNLFFIFFLSGITLSAQTILQPGDLAIVGVNANYSGGACPGTAAEDRVSIVFFRDLTAGTTFDATDNGWESPNPGFWGDIEGTVRFTWNGPATIPAGTVITFSFQTGGIYAAMTPAAYTNWSFTSLNDNRWLNLNSGGDQFYVMANGNWDNNGGWGGNDATYSGQILYAFNTKTAWVPFQNSTQESGLHPQAIPCFHMEPTGGTTNYVSYTGPTSAVTQLEWIDRISNPANWTSYPDCSSYVFPPEFLPIAPSTMSVNCTTCNACNTYNSFLVFNLVSFGGPFDVVYTDGTNFYTLNNISNGYVVAVTVTQNVTYSLVSVTDVNNCPVYSNFDGQAVMTISGSSSADAGPDQTICPGESASLTATGGGTYLWSTNQTGATISVSPSSTTTYTVTVTNSGCTATDQVVVNVNTFPPGSIELECDANCTGCSGTTLNSTLQLLLPVTGGPFTVVYTDGTNNYTLNNVSNGYSFNVMVNQNTSFTLVSVTAANGCIKTTNLDSNADITFSDPTVNAGPDQTICQGNPATLTATGTGTFQWSTSQTGASINVSPTSTTTYTVTVTLNGCTATDVVKVNVTAAPAAFAGPDQSICSGGSGTNLTATGGGTYSWSNSQTGANISVNPSSTTTYTVTVTLSGCTATDDVTVNVNPLPNADAGNGQNLCQGGSATLTASGGGTYAWSTSQSGSTINVTPASSTTYTVTVTLNGCTATDAVTVNVYSNLSTSNLVELCGGAAGSNNYSVTFQINGGNSGAYTVTGGTGGTLNGNTFTGNPIPSGTAYTYTINDGGVCGPITISGNPNCDCITNAGSISTTPIHVCNGQSVTAVQTVPPVLDGNDIIVYILSSTSTLTVPGIITVSFTPTFSFNSSTMTLGTTYYIFAVAASVNAFGTIDLGDACLSVSQPEPVSWNTPPTATLSGSTSICNGQTASLTVVFTGSAPFTFTYTSNGQSHNVTTSSNPYVFLVTPSVTTTYVLTSVTDNNCSGTFNGTATVTVSQAPTATLNTANQSICGGTSASLSIGFTGTGPWTFTYTANGAPTTITTSNNPYLLSVSPNTNTTYQLTAVSNALCSGTFSGSTILTVIPPPTATLTGGTSMCAGQSATLQVGFTGTGPFSFTYLSNGANPVTLNNVSNPYSFTVNPAQTTDYLITNVSDFNCSVTSTSSQTVTVHPLPTAIIDGVDAICNGDNTTLSVYFTGTGPFHFTYLTNGNNPINITTSNNPYIFNVSPTSTTTYSLSAISDAFCTGTTLSSQTIAVNTPPSATLSGGGAGCSGQSISLSVGFAGPGPYTFTYVGNNANPVTISTSSNPYVFTVSPGSNTTYTLEEVFNASCYGTVSGSAVATINPSPTAILSGGGNICAGESANLSVNFTGTAPYTFSYSANNGAPVSVTTSNDPYTLSVNPTVNTNYTLVSVQDGLCTGTVNGTASLTVNPVPGYSNLMTDCISGTQYHVVFTITGGTAPFAVSGGVGGSVSGNTFTSNPMNIGTPFVFFIEDANFCGPVSVNGVLNSCNCITSAGNMNLTAQNVCGSGSVTATFAGGQVLDGDDVLQYILHTTSGQSLGTVLATANTPTFSFGANMTYGTTYYISAIAGNLGSNGNVDLTDGCLSISQGTPVIFYQVPTATLGAVAPICEGQCADMAIVFMGTPPYTLQYQILHDGSPVATQNISTSNNNYTLSVCPASLNINSGSVSIQPISLQDAHCQSIPLASGFNIIPAASGTLNQSLCPGQSIVVGGQTFNQANPSGSVTLANASVNGCDSTVTVALTYFTNPVNNISQTLCTGQSISINGTVYNAAHPSGTETLVNAAANGCDSIVNVNLTFSNASVFNLSQTLCAGQTVTVNGQTFNQANPIGSVTIPNGSTAGCDSIVNVSLTFISPSVHNLAQTLCPGQSVTVNGQTFGQANPNGTVLIPNGSSSGCDSIVNVSLTFSNASVNNLSQTLCPGQTITVNEQTFSQANPAGVVLIPNGSVAGCDSVINVTLTYLSNPVHALSQNLCIGQSLNINGTIYSQANPTGTEVLSGQAANGCDSIIQIQLTFSNQAINNINQTLCPGQSIQAGNQTFNQANPVGTVLLPNGSVAGCDSVINVQLNFLNNPVHNLNQTLCFGQSISVNGTVYDQAHPSGTEVLAGQASNGCDSIVNINLVFSNGAVHNLNQTLCPGEVVVVNGQTFNQSNPNGTVTIANGSSAGCDSIVNVSLTYLSVPTFNLIQTLCPGELVVVNGNVYNELHSFGIETLNGAAANGCDSIVEIYLIYLAPGIHNIASNMCSGETFTIQGQTFSESNPSGTVTITNGSASGCDSIIHVSLTYFPTPVFNLNQTLCPGQSVTVGGQLFDQSNPQGAVVLPNASAGGCDSTVNVNLTYPPAAVHNLVQTLCPGETVTVNGQVFNAANPVGTVVIPNGSSAGCDSTVNVSLTYLSNPVNNLTQTLCFGESLIVNGVTYNQANPSGMETLSGAAANGCDSIVQVNLSFSNAAVFNLSQTLCPGQTVTVNGQVFSVVNPTGTVTIPNGSVSGCDSVVNVQLTYQPVPFVSLSGNTTVCSGSGATITVQVQVVPGAVFDLTIADNFGNQTTYPSMSNGGIITVTPAVSTQYHIVAVLLQNSACTALLDNTPVSVQVNTVLLTAAALSDFNGFEISCNGQSDGAAMATLTGGTAPLTYQWSNGSLSGTISNLTAGDYSVTVTDAAGCSASASVTLTEPSKLLMQLDTQTPSCAGREDGAIQLQSISGGSAPYEWSMDGQAFQPAAAFPVIISNLGSGYYQLSVRDASGCEEVESAQVPEAPQVFVDAGADIHIVLGDSARLEGITNFVPNSIVWSPTQFLSRPDSLITWASPDYTTEYRLTLSDSVGCTATDRLTVFVDKPRHVYIPNAFSPNGDGYNDVFTIYSTDPSVVQVNRLRVYDRWGNMMFEDSNFYPNDDSHGWSGWYRGKEMNPAVFVYYAEILFTDGVVIMYKGDVTLVR